MTNDGSRKVIRELGLDEVITVTSSDDKHQVIQRIYLKYDSEVIVMSLRTLTPKKLQIKRIIGIVCINRIHRNCAVQITLFLLYRES